MRPRLPRLPLFPRLRAFVGRASRSTAGAARTEPGFHGELVLLGDLPSRFLPTPHRVQVYLPPGYRTGAARYPVLYMQDGQNLFDPRTSFLFGRDWRLGETLESLRARRRIEPLVVVAVWNAGTERIFDYTPTPAPAHPEAGRADDYGRFLAEELKPLVDATFRTKPDAANTGIGGSSLGGLLALHVGLTRPATFGKIAALSPSAWWNDEALRRAVSLMPAKGPARIWLDIGSAEGDEAVAAVRRLGAALRAKGWSSRRDLRTFEAAGGTHDEDAWSRRAGKVFQFLFPARLLSFFR